MKEPSELDRLLSQLVYRADLKYLEGLDAFRNRLERDSDGKVLRFLTKAMEELEGERRAGIAYAVAEHYLKTGNLKSLQKLYSSADPIVKESVLNALWGEPNADPCIGPGIVQLAIEAASHPVARVRMEACRVLQNQCAWRVDVSDAVGSLRSLLKDQDGQVRYQAAYAVGTLARFGYDMSSHVPFLRRNLKHRDIYVPLASAWALWQLSRHKHDIGSAVPELVSMLKNRMEYDNPKKMAAGALLHHARTSKDNGKQVKQSVRAAQVRSKGAVVKKFLEQLAKLT